MEIREFGAEKQETIIFLHGGGLSWWNYREEAELLKDRYHIVIPFLDGHAGSDKPFSTIESNTGEIISFINNNLGGSVFMICGLSLGGQILLEILSQQGDICRHALIESAMATPSKITHALIRPSVVSSYPLIRRRWFAKLQFKQLRIKDELFDDYYRDTCAIRKNDMIAFLRANTSYILKDSIKNCTANVRVCFGEKENSGIRRSAALINRTVPNSTLFALPAMYHGEFSINHADAYVEEISKLH